MNSLQTLPYLFLDASETSLWCQIGQENQLFTRFRETHQRLDSMIISICQEMLDACNLSLDDINQFGVCVGPGSFTGLRTAITFMRTLAQVTEKPIRGVDLFSWAAQTLVNTQTNGSVCLVLPTYQKKHFVNEIIFSSGEKPLVPKPWITSQLAFKPDQTVYGVRCEIPGIPSVIPSPTALDTLMKESLKSGFKEILSVLPWYILPTQAELNLKK